LPHVIFDLDGLMVDSEPLARIAWEQVLLTHDRRLDERTYHKIIGLRLADTSRLLQETYQLDVQAEDLGRAKEAAMNELLLKGVPAMPGLMKLLAALQQRGLAWGVATSSRHSYAQLVLDQLALLEQAGAIAGGDEVSRGKPFPDIYLLAARRLGAQPGSCLALEDSAPGAKAATAAGMLTVAIPGDHTRAAEFAFVDAVYPSLDKVADDLDRLLARFE
jgi:HAD superfamily hydrolase (TIGR01509 family)